MRKGMNRKSKDMAQGLFRPEAIAAQRRDWLGTIHLARSTPRWIAAGTAVAFAAAMLLFVCLGQYTRRERVSGQLVPHAGLLAISAGGTGKLSRVLVREGQTVRKGEALAEISGELDSAAFGGTLARVSERLQVQRARLESDLQVQQETDAQQRQALLDKQNLLRSQLAEVDGQLQIQQRQIDSGGKLLARIRPLLEKGYVSAFQVQQQESSLLDAQAQRKNLQRQRLDLQQQLDAAAQQLARLPLDAQTQRHETERKLADTDQTLAHNEAQRALLLRAPGDGVVSAVLLKSGQAVSAGQTVLSILPRGEELEAQLLLPSRAAGFVETGHRVVLRYQAYPYQKFGQQYGRVVEISRNALTPAEVSALTGQQTQEPLYRLLVRLERQDIHAYGRFEPLRAGMALDADILMDRRRLIEWLFEPLYGLRQQLAAGKGERHG